MNQIQIISASAGSGKTYRLAQLLEEEVTAGRVRPEAVLATTFTNKAAAELQERVRVKLLSADRTADAQRLGAARMGTVNSICGRLVGDFAFELGLSPQLTVLDEEMTALALRRSLACVLTAEEEAELSELSQRMVEFHWQSVVKSIVDLARSNGMDAKQVQACAERSRNGFLRLLGTREPEGDKLDVNLAQALAKFIKAVRDGTDTTQATAKAVERAENALQRLKANFDLPWKEWVGLAKLKAARASDEAAEVVRVAAAAQDRHPRLHQDVSRAIELVFGLAARGLDAFQEHKRQLGAIDFVDQENLALQLLSRQSVQEQLREDLDLVLVDEFQDTSPIQLAIFLKLAEIAPRNVWVGDQKQAIYGFRGTDPALMDAAIAAILGSKEPETLPKSYRSRPELVTFTSELFGPAFEGKGIPPSRVKLKPALKDEPKGLGVVLECWDMVSKNKGEDAAALAAAVRQLLADDVSIRDPGTGQVRKLRPGDVAILCRTNATCEAVAQQLAALGIRAVLPRLGLMSRPEARAVLAGLNLWVDGGDALAAAELARLIGYAGRDDAWLKAVLKNPGSEAFAEDETVRTVLTACEAQPRFGSLAVFDAVVEAVGVRDLCLQWGDAQVRLANLEALRGHAVVYVQSCASQGTGCTPAGLVAYLGSLATEAADSQGVRRDENAVVISTWHSAKGLEWPVTVLSELYRRGSDLLALGVRPVSDRPKVDLADPLAKRWIRYWPNPYSSQNNGMPFHDRLEQDPATQEAMEQAEREDLRLLYVGWTRARDRVVLSSRQGTLAEGILALLTGKERSLVNEPEEKKVVWAGQKVAIVRRDAGPADPVTSKPLPAAGYAVAGPREHPPAFIRPSDVPGVGKVADRYEEIHPRLPLSGKPEWSDLGNAIHAFLCADRQPFTGAGRTALAKDILERWGVLSALTPGDLLTASDGLRAWIEKNWPKAVWHREWPVMRRQADGSIVRGSSDLALEIPAGLVLVDHKSFPGSIAQALEKAGQFVGQLSVYADAIAAATGRPIVATFIHLPVSGIVVPIERLLNSAEGKP